MEDRTWARDPIFLERQRQTLADIHRRVDALTAWFAWAREEVARRERQYERERTAQLGRYEVNDEPGPT